jgi:hypothetical protein
MAMPVTPQAGVDPPPPASQAGNNPSPPDDLAGFAQEFLRRNPSYRRDFQRLAKGGSMPHAAHSDKHEEMARHWGLCFSM